MSKLEYVIIAVCAGTAAVLALFPPWARIDINGHVTNIFVGHAWLQDAPVVHINNQTYSTAISIGWLACEWFALASAALALIALARALFDYDE